MLVPHTTIRLRRYIASYALTHLPLQTYSLSRIHTFAQIRICTYSSPTLPLITRTGLRFLTYVVTQLLTRRPMRLPVSLPPSVAAPHTLNKRILHAGLITDFGFIIIALGLFRAKLRKHARVYANLRAE